MVLEQTHQLTSTGTSVSSYWPSPSRAFHCWTRYFPTVQDSGSELCTYFEIHSADWIIFKAYFLSKVFPLIASFWPDARSQWGYSKSTNHRVILSEIGSSHPITFQMWKLMSLGVKNCSIHTDILYALPSLFFPPSSFLIYWITPRCHALFSVLEIQRDTWHSLLNY